MNIIIRPETRNDIEAIENVTRAAFTGKSYSAGTEPLIITRLREANVLTLSLVAEIGGSVVGHVAFSPVTIDQRDLRWFGLGPVSVLPGLQKQGIGSQLIRKGLSLLKEQGAQGCVLEGDPTYYQRFGFHSHPALTYDGAPALEYFMALPFYESTPMGKVEYHEAFYV